LHFEDKIPANGKKKGKKKHLCSSSLTDGPGHNKSDVRRKTEICI
jgi:hypothetical protein